MLMKFKVCRQHIDIQNWSDDSLAEISIKQLHYIKSADIFIVTG